MPQDDLKSVLLPIHTSTTICLDGAIVKEGVEKLGVTVSQSVMEV